MEAALLATDRLDLLRLFVRIAETGRISEAARSVGISQPSASRCLRLLESVMGAKLIERSTHGLSLTPAGLSLLDRARHLLAAWDEAVEAAGAERQELAGLIRVVAPVAVGQTLLAAVAARFLRRHPEVRIEWDLRDDVLDMTSAGCDLWIRVGELPQDDLVVRHVYDIKRAVVASPAFRAVEHPRELSVTPAVRLTSFVPVAVRLVRDDGASFVLRQSAVFSTSNLHAAHVAALEGVGYAVLPLWLVQDDLSRGALTMLCPDWQPPGLHLSLAYAPTGQRSSRLRALIDFIRAELTSDGGLGITFLRELGAVGTVERIRSG
jgi:molybdate transport repressor ModE-like protein